MLALPGEGGEEGDVGPLRNAAPAFADNVTVVEADAVAIRSVNSSVDRSDGCGVVDEACRTYSVEYVHVDYTVRRRPPREQLNTLSADDR